MSQTLIVRRDHIVQALEDRLYKAQKDHIVYALEIVYFTSMIKLMTVFKDLCIVNVLEYRILSIMDCILIIINRLLQNFNLDFRFSQRSSAFDLTLVIWVRN